MAAALGAKVYPGHYKEIGWSALHGPIDNPLMAPLLTPGVSVLHWHGDTFDLPEGATLLAGSSHYPNQAFAWGDNALALQFHPEVKTSHIERWLIGHACELARTEHVDVSTLRAESRANGPVLEQAAQLFWRQWLAGRL
jgi:GMP synthase (glutamine-hydrolysing)